jgi:outer membrane immunogenic protein
MDFRSFLLALTTACLPAGAFAADQVTVQSLSSSSPPFFTWSGFYGGEGGVYNWTDGTPKKAPEGFWATAFDAISSAFTAANSTSPEHIHAFVGGGQIGFNYQIRNLVLGVEGDLSYTGLDTAAGVFGPPRATESLAFTSGVSSHWLSTLRARFGTTIDERMLVYATGGLALAGRNFTNGYAILSPDGEDFSMGGSSRFAAGLAIGGGVEYALTKNWTLKGEYLYADVGPGRSFLPDDSATSVPSAYRQGDLSEKILRAAINYKFDWLAGPGTR